MSTDSLRIQKFGKETANQKPTLMDKFLIPVDKNLQVNKSRSPTISEEIAAYGTLARKNLAMGATRFWKQYGNQMPILKLQARQYLATPGTSVPSEFAFR